MNRNKFTLFILCFFLSFFHSFAQSKLLTMEEAIITPKLNPSSLQNVSFLPNGNYFCYQIPQNKSPKLYIVNVENQSVDSSLSLNTLNNSLKVKKYPELKRMPYVEWVNQNNFTFTADGKLYNFNRISLEINLFFELPSKYNHMEWAPNKEKAAFSIDKNLFVSNSNGQLNQITFDGTYGIVYGEPVHRNEFGINKGMFWSNDGKKLAFYRMDESKVTDYFIYQNNTMPASVDKIKYPFAGATSHSVQVGIYDVEKGTMLYLKTSGPQDQYLTNISWSPDNQYIYLAKVSRDQKNMWLERYWANDGNLDQIVLEEFNNKYIEPENPPVFIPWNENQFIWQSERDGFNHLYLYGTDGKLIKQLTKGSWVVTKLLQFNQESNLVYFEGTKDSPLEKHVYAVNILSGKIYKITQESAMHNVIISSNGKYLLDKYSSLTIPGKLDLLSESGAVLTNIYTAPNPLEEYALGETSIFPIKNGNTTLYARMIKPLGFNPEVQYPVVVYVYGGPHVQLVHNSWLGGSNLWMQFMAQQGYIVFTIDNRGSLNRGFDFESAVHGKLGTLEMEDQIAGIEFLKKQAYVDASRIGVHGWSFGGFMTTSLMSRNPGLFKVGVAGGPVIDWKMYEIMYTERYMGNPEGNKQGYDTANLLNHVANLEGKLLMIHGCDDDVVLWQHSLLYLQKAVEMKKTNVDYFVYPGHKHNVVGKDRLHLMQKVTEYLFENL